MPQSDRRDTLIAEIIQRTGIDETMIDSLVRTFYDRVRDDPLIGPIFDARITDWEAHLKKMCEFWSAVALMSGRYSGQPMPKHIRLPVDARHFDRWLALFEQTASDVCPPAAAWHFVERARRIAQSFELGIATCNNVMLAPDHRLYRPDEDVYLPEESSENPEQRP